MIGDRVFTPGLAQVAYLVADEHAGRHGFAPRSSEVTMARFTGQTLMLIGALHTLVGLLNIGPLADIARAGVFNAVGSHTDREAAVWFLMTGVALLLVGYVTRWTQRQTGTLPAALGWTLLAIATVGLVLMPRSGFWLLVPAAVLALAAARHGSARVAAPARRGLADGSRPS
jgi:hypothetical protein